MPRSANVCPRNRVRYTARMAIRTRNDTRVPVITFLSRAAASSRRLDPPVGMLRGKLNEVARSTMASARGTSVPAARTHRLVLLGSYLDHCMQTDTESKPRVMKGLDEFLTRDQDRAVFNLAPRFELSAPARLHGPEGNLTALIAF